MRGGCGSEVVLETVNATRAFLTIDSGFPLAELEQDLRTNRPFTYDYKPTASSGALRHGLLAERERKAKAANSSTHSWAILRCAVCTWRFPSWIRRRRKSLRKRHQRSKDPRLCARAGFLRRHVPDSRRQSALVPGGARSEKAWAESGGRVARQGRPCSSNAWWPRTTAGWPAISTRSRASITPASAAVQNYLTEPERLKRFYAAIRGKVTSPGPARPVFRSNTDMMLLTARLRLDPDGKPHIPGSLEVWRTLFIEHPPARASTTPSSARRRRSWKDPDDVLEALFGLCRKVGGE